MVYLFESASVIDPSAPEMNWTMDDRKLIRYLSETIGNFTVDMCVLLLLLKLWSFLFRKFTDWPVYHPHQCSQALTIDQPSNHTLRDFFTSVNVFWDDVVSTIESLNLYSDFEYYPKRCHYHNCEISSSSTTSSAVTFQMPFFILLICAFLVLFTFVILLCFVRMQSSAKVAKQRYTIDDINSAN